MDLLIFRDEARFIFRRCAWIIADRRRYAIRDPETASTGRRYKSNADSSSPHSLVPLSSGGCSVRARADIPMTTTTTTTMTRKVLKAAIAILVICGAFVKAEVVSECQKSSDCPSGQCCMIGGSRYSIPRCEGFAEEGKSCRPTGAMPTLNTTLSYPDGSVLQVEDVYFVMCPCADGLSCNAAESLCRKTLE